MKTIIIGGLAAGMSAASKLKRMDKQQDVLVVEKGHETSYGACGLPYYISGENPHKDLLRIRKPAEFEQAGIRLMLGHEVISADFKQKEIKIKNLDNGREFAENYNNLLIASGSVSIIPQWPGVNLKNVFSIKTLEDSDLIKSAITADVRRIVVIGGGYIGLEMSEAFLRLGRSVTLLEKEKRLLTAFDPIFSCKVSEHLSTHGMEIRAGETVLKLEGNNCVRTVVTDKGCYDADLVLIAIGVRPNTGFLDMSGIERLKNGAIVTDDRMRTSVPYVWAAGDCTTVWHRLLGRYTYIPLATNANKQGRYAADNILGRPRRYMNALGTVMLKVADLELGKTGLSEEEAIANNVPYGSTVITGVDHAPYYPNQNPIIVKLVYRPCDGALLGAQLIGNQGAALRTNTFAACISADMTVSKISELDFGYAPPYAMPWDIMHLAANAAETNRLKTEQEAGIK